jgi:hypothetical protein
VEESANELIRFVEYDLACEPLKFIRGQTLADFIIEHRIGNGYEKMLEGRDGRYKSIIILRLVLFLVIAFRHAKHHKKSMRKKPSF